MFCKNIFQFKVSNFKPKLKSIKPIKSDVNLFFITHCFFLGSTMKLLIKKFKKKVYLGEVIKKMVANFV